MNVMQSFYLRLVLLGFQMDKVKSKISKVHLSRRIFPEDDYQNLMVDLSQKHVSISGIGIFSVDYKFLFIVRPLLISLIFSATLQLIFYAII